MLQDPVQSIDSNIKKSQEFVELNKALERLESSRDFTKVIKEGYLEKEAIRLVHLKANPAMQTPYHQVTIIKQIDAIGGLLGYLQGIGLNASIAVQSIVFDEAAREEILAETI